MSVANSSHRAALLRVLLILLVAQNLARCQLTPAPVQICHSFHCFGEMCYQEAEFANQIAECEPGEDHCELIQLTAAHYMARCSSRCEGEIGTDFSPCLLANNSALSLGPCSLQCCSGGPLCLVLNELDSGLGHLTIQEDKLVLTPTAFVRNKKICATFSCQGSNCFKGQKAVALCPVGVDFCELKRFSSGYTAGCSQACMAGIHRCYGAVTQSCFQECCQASTSGSCLQLDGNLHFNQAAPGATRNPLYWSLVGAMLLLNSALLLFLLP